uniref:DUF4340 domain-containing protein n=1 Tax=Colwellia sp. An23 TaxID=1719924 RepID=A0A125T5C9_9GAMM|nr:hypothetical protein [Colwellia sp. An23]
MKNILSSNTWLITKIAAYFMIFSVLFSCSQDEKTNDTNTKIAEIDYLIPYLRSQKVKHIVMKTSSYQVNLSQKNNSWWLNKPFDYPASISVVELLLSTFIDAEIGKRIKVNDKDLENLQLNNDGQGIHISLDYESGDKLKVILGKLDFPRDKFEAGILGPGYSARRFVRIIKTINLVTTDQVYWIPFALVNLPENPEFWTDSAMVRIPSIKSLTVVKNNVLQARYTRTHMFGDLTHSTSNSTSQIAPAESIQCLETFLSYGKNYSVGKANETFDTAKKVTNTVLIIEDFLGLQYKMTLGYKQLPSASEKQRAELTAGALSNGEAPVKVPFLIEVNSIEDKLTKALTPIENTLRKSNLRIAEKTHNRIVYGVNNYFSCIAELGDTL